jgi:NAD(P)H-dependent FMN reductase
MIQPVRILGIPGSLRQGSYNRAALRAAIELVPGGATLDVFELHGIPGFNQDDEGNPPLQVAELKRRIREADALLFVTPEYAAGTLTDDTTKTFIRELLRNLVDWTRKFGQRPKT